MCECRTRSDRSTHFLFAVAHSAECARGMSHFGRTATWKTQDWCERQDRFGLDLRIKPRRGGGGPSVQGGKGQGCARNSEFLSYCITPGSLPDNIFRPFAGNLALRPGECRSSHSISRDAFSCDGSISQQYCVLDHRFPLLVTLFVIIGLPFLFSHTRRSSSLSLSSLSIASTRG